MPSVRNLLSDNLSSRLSCAVCFSSFLMPHARQRPDLVGAPVNRKVRLRNKGSPRINRRGAARNLSLGWHDTTHIFKLLALSFRARPAPFAERRGISFFCLCTCLRSFLGAPHGGFPCGDFTRGGYLVHTHASALPRFFGCHTCGCAPHVALVNGQEVGRMHSKCLPPDSAFCECDRLPFVRHGPSPSPVGTAQVSPGRQAWDQPQNKSFAPFLAAARLWPAARAVRRVPTNSRPAPLISLFDLI
jgi:hypothetical protein